MNCQEFENLLHSFASGRLLDLVEQAKGLAHSERCSRCQTRLLNERLLATGLRTLAAEARKKEAPARIETALLEAFRHQERPAIPGTGL